MIKSIPYLKIENLNVILEKNLILESFNMAIYPEEIISLIGPSGCGKTTLLKTIAGFLPIQAGEIFIGKKLIQNPSKSLPPYARNMSMVFQDYALFPHLNVLENIKFSKKKFSSKKSNFLEGLIQGLQLESLLKKYPNEISGGQQQRASVARAIFSRPKFLLMDEPFASQDVELKDQVMEVVYTLLKKEGITCLIVTHEQSVALKFSDRIGIMQNKKIEQIDSPFNVFHHPKKYFTASFIGEGTFLKGKIAGNVLVSPLGKFTDFQIIQDDNLNKKNNLKENEVLFLIRSHEIKIDKSSNIKALVIGKYFKGDSYVYKLHLTSGEIIISAMPYQDDFLINEKVGVKFFFNKKLICFK